MTLLEEYATEIATQARKMTELLQKKDIALPSFSQDGPSSVPAGPDFKEIQEARMSLIDAAAAIQQLAIGPEDWIKWQALTVRPNNLTIKHINFDEG